MIPLLQQNIKINVQEPPKEVKFSHLLIRTGSEQSKDWPHEGGNGTGPASKVPQSCLRALLAAAGALQTAVLRTSKGIVSTPRACQLLEGLPHQINSPPSD